MIALLNAAVFGLIPVPLIPSGSCCDQDVPEARFVEADDLPEREVRRGRVERMLIAMLSEVGQPNLFPANK
jgi:hypothetical protein